MWLASGIDVSAAYTWWGVWEGVPSSPRQLIYKPPYRRKLKQQAEHKNTTPMNTCACSLPDVEVVMSVRLDGWRGGGGMWLRLDRW